MPDHDLEKLLGGFAADTLTPEEKQRLYNAALHDQQLFNSLADDQALKELLADPVVRDKLLRSLRETNSTTEGGNTSWLDWFRRPAGLAWAGGLVTAFFAVILGTNLYLESLREASRLIINEDAPTTTRHTPLPSAAQPTSPPIHDSQPEAQAKTKPAASLKKEALTAKTLQHETGANAERKEERGALYTEPDALRGPTELTSQTVSHSKEGVPDSTDHDHATVPSTSGSVPAPPTVPATGVPAAQVGSALSVRSLFYGETAESTSGVMHEQQRHDALQRIERLEQLERSSPSNQAHTPVGSTKPLGLRFSLVANEGERPHDVGEAGAPLRTSSVDLMLESNQAGFFQVWGEADSLQPHLLFPFSPEDPIASRLMAYQPRRIPILAGYHLISVRLSRMPFGPGSATDQDAMKQSPAESLQESTTSTGPSGSQVQTTYVVNPDASSAMLTVRIPIHRP